MHETTAAEEALADTAMTLAEAVARADAARVEGNAHFVSKRYPEALDCYSTGLTHLTAYPNETLRSVLLCNRAAVLIQTGKFEEAEADCTTVIERVPDHVKAYYRRAQAREGQRKLRDALEGKDGDDVSSSAPSIFGRGNGKMKKNPMHGGKEATRAAQ